MSVEKLRNVMTGEIRDIETTSDEYLELINEVYDHQGSARPKWEITGSHHSAKVDASPDDTDLGYQYKPIPGAEVDISEVGPEASPVRALTEGEIEAGLKDVDQKEKELVTVDSNAGEVEQIEETPVAERREAGQAAAGTASNKTRRSSSSAKKANGPSSSGSSSSASAASGGSGS